MEWYQGDLQKAVVAEDWPKVNERVRSKRSNFVLAGSGWPLSQRKKKSKSKIEI